MYSSLDFKNGKGEIVGKLTPVLEKRRRASVYLNMVETRSLVLKWTQCKSGILSAIQKKEKAADKRIIEWVKKSPKVSFPG